MGRNHWNAKRWHRSHRVDRRRANPLWGPAIVVALALLTGAVAAGHDAIDARPDRIGICHATGDETTPHVYIVVARDGVDHAHHLGHADDALDVHSQAECPIASETTSTPDSGCLHGSDAEHAAAEPGQNAANETGNETADHTGPIDNETQNRTEPSDPDLEGLCDADVAASGNASQSGEWVRMEFQVDSVRSGEANDVRLDATLPDVGRSWRLVANTTGCLLDGLAVSCEFGDLIAGASRNVAVKAPRCADDCGDDLEARVMVAAHNDGNATNDEADVILVVEDCPRGAPAPTTSTAAPTTNATSTSPAAPTSASTGPAPAPTPPSNQTNETDEPSNATTPNTTQPAPARRDASTSQRTEQDDDQVVFTIVVRSLGDAAARNVRLADTLPDVRRSWHLSGADSGDCTLDGRYLNCWFGDLEPGTQRSILVKAYTDRMPCGQHLTNIPVVSSEDDANARNDRATGSIEARSC